MEAFIVFLVLWNLILSYFLWETRDNLIGCNAEQIKINRKTIEFTNNVNQTIGIHTRSIIDTKDQLAEIRRKLNNEIKKRIEHQQT